jgi:hypothetical protein
MKAAFIEAVPAKKHIPMCGEERHHGGARRRAVWQVFTRSEE